MKIQFDAQQQYQLDAVASVVDLFDGQPLQQPEYSVVYQQGDSGLFEGQVQTEVRGGQPAHPERRSAPGEHPHDSGAE